MAFFLLLIVGFRVKIVTYREIHFRASLYEPAIQTVLCYCITQIGQGTYAFASLLFTITGELKWPNQVKSPSLTDQYCS